jgi:hypothetical protein
VDGALEVDLLALRAVVADDLRGLAEDLDAVPLRALLLLAVLPVQRSDVAREKLAMGSPPWV